MKDILFIIFIAFFGSLIVHLLMAVTFGFGNYTNAIVTYYEEMKYL